MDIQLSAIIARIAQMLASMQDFLPTNATTGSVGIGLMNNDPSYMSAFGVALANTFRLPQDKIIAWLSSPPGREQVKAVGMILANEYDGDTLLTDVTSSNLTGSAQPLGTGILAAILGIAGAVGAVAAAVNTGINAFGPKPGQPGQPPSATPPVPAPAVTPSTPTSAATPSSKPEPDWLDLLGGVDTLSNGVSSMLDGSASVPMGDGRLGDLAQRLLPPSSLGNDSSVIQTLSATEALLAGLVTDSPNGPSYPMGDADLDQLLHLERSWSKLASADSASPDITQFLKELLGT